MIKQGIHSRDKRSLVDDFTIYETFGSKIGLCYSRKYPQRCYAQLGGKKKLGKDHNLFDIVEELHCTHEEALKRESEWSTLKGYPTDSSKNNRAHIRGTKVVTPLGEFISLQTAGKAHNKYGGWVKRQCDDPSIVDFYYL